MSYAYSGLAGSGLTGGGVYYNRALPAGCASRPCKGFGTEKQKAAGLRRRGRPNAWVTFLKQHKGQGLDRSELRRQYYAQQGRFTPLGPPQGPVQGSRALVAV
jgi:hypothetical protein